MNSASRSESPMACFLIRAQRNVAFCDETAFARLQENTHCRWGETQDVGTTTAGRQGKRIDVRLAALASVCLHIRFPPHDAAKAAPCPRRPAIYLFGSRVRGDRRP